jgi:hypothetical protein
MKSLILVLFIITSFGAYSQTEAELVKLEDQRMKAIIARDSVTLSSMYDAAYRGVLTTGREVTKKEVIEFQLASNPYIKITIEGVKATLHGNVAITTGVQVNRSKSGTLLGRSKFVRTYLKKDNGWKIIYSQGTLIAGEEM